MGSSFLVALANFRRRKLQNILIGLCILLSVLFMTTAIGILGGIHKPFDEMFDKMKASHILLFYDFRTNNSEELIAWFNNQPEVEYVTGTQNFYMITEPFLFNSKKIDIMVRLTEYQIEQTGNSQVLKMEGDEKSSLGWGEIWIPRHMATRYQIAVGDTIEIPVSKGLFPLKVSAIIIDPHYASGLINPNRLWIAPGMLPFMVQPGKLNNVMVGVRLFNKENIDELWAKFNREVNYSGSNLQYSLFKSVFTSIYKIIGLVLIIFSVMAMLISGFIIFSIISSNIMADSQLAGVLKALGFKSSEIINVYLIQYAILSIVFIPLGLILSYFTTNAILRSLLESIGLLNFDFPFFWVFLICSISFIVLILGLVRWFSGKVGKVSPAMALKSNIGDTNISRNKSKFQINIFKHSLTFWIAVKLILDNPKRNILSFLSLIIAVFIIGFSVNTSYSFQKINEHKSLWGFDNSDLQVRRSNEVILPVKHEDFVYLMENDEAIKDVVPFDYYELSIPASDNKPPVVLNGKVFESSPTKIGLINIEGEHPMGENEISLCVGTAKRLNKTIGDTTTLLLENELKFFTVTGIYQDVSNLGEGFRLSLTAIKSINPIFKPGRYALLLTDKNALSSVKSKLLKRFGEAIKIELTIEEQLGFMGITKSINASLFLISLFFIGVLLVSVFSDLVLSTWENRKSIGVYKLLGFTPLQLKLIMTWKVFIKTLVGIIVGLPLAIFLGPKVMSAITSGMGLVKFPFIIWPLGSLLIIPFILFVTLLSGWLSSGKLEKINPRILVNE
jgi:putative ABC transport system permease protein